ncbi:hypothetical protein FHS14_002439 [Paenibacillus baekrokdamisoli]|nr:hypothetical protein [Paenibacillus baekrokdamisoli]
MMRVFDFGGNEINSNVIRDTAADDVAIFI